VSWSFKLPLRGTARQQLLSGGAASVAIKMASLGANLIITVLLARLLAPSGYGVYSLALAIISLLAIPIQLGLPTLVLREVAKAAAREDWGFLRSLIRWVHRVILTSAVAVAGLAIGVAWLLKARLEAGFFFTMLFAAPLLAVASLTSVRQSVLMGMKRIILAQLPELLFLPLLYLICIACASLFGPHPVRPQTAMSAYVACYCVAFILGSVFLSSALPAGAGSIATVTPMKGWMKSIVALSLVSGLSVISAQAIIPIMGLLASDETIGLYRVAASGAAMTTVVGATIGSLVSPYIATYYSQKDFAKLQLLATYSAWACLVPALIVLAFYSSFAATLLGLTFGPRFAEAAGALVVLTTGQVINCATGIVHSLLIMTGHEQDTLRGSVLGVTVNVALAFALVPKFGLMGAAAATCTAVAAENALLYFTVRSRLNIGSSILPFGRPRIA